MKGANLSVVISNLPEKTTLEEISAFCRTVGVIATHPQTGENLILYNPRRHRATVTYNYPEGANRAIDILSEECFNGSTRVTVERAKREPYDFSKWKSAMKEQRKFHSYLGDHEEELKTTEQKRMKIMILKGVFEPKEMIKNPELYGKIVEDWTQIGQKFGKVTLVKPIEAHPEGVVIVRFEEPQAAAIAIGEMDAAQYRNRIITAEPWDGSDLSVRESEADVQQRIENYQRYIDGNCE